MARVARSAGHFTMNLIALLTSILRRRPVHVPLTEEQIAALAADADAFEAAYGTHCKGPAVVEDAK